MPVVYRGFVPGDYCTRWRLHLTGERLDSYPFVIVDNSSQSVDRSTGWRSALTSVGDRGLMTSIWLR